MEVRVVNLQTGITAVRESRPLGAIAGERVAEKQVSVAVPNGYDYEISIRLVEGGAAFATSTGRVTLAPPSQVVLAGGQSRVVFDSGKATSPVPTQAPGLGVAFTVTGLFGAGLAVLARQKR